MKCWTALAILVAIAALVVVSGVKANDLRWIGPLAGIRDRLAPEFPPGTPRREIEARLLAKGMPITLRQNIGLRDGKGELAGTTHVCARAYEYRIFLVRFDITVCMAFDEGDHLVRLEVRRSSDSI